MSQQKIIKETLQYIVGERFGRYSKYIIQDRALPDVRDGLKPVQRRILYAMYHEGNLYSKAFRKSAKTVGNVIGNYHPHGDSSVYEAMVRLSQEWKMLEPLVQMHGNNGSIDGDTAAAMRYTEARLSKISELLLTDIDKQTVDFIPNFDDSDTEPTVLPARYPNLLVNGSTGISAGYATDIPPHHLGEVIQATIELIKKTESTTEHLMKFMQGPEFPGGGIVQGKEGIQSAFETGKGKVIVRAKVAHDVKGNKHQLIISEIPYEVNKANLVRQIDEIRANKGIDGILEVRDESDRDGLSIIVELRKDSAVEAIENYLYKNTDLQVNYNYNMVAIYKGQPRLMGIRQILTAYIEHQLDVLTRRTTYDLQKALKRAHIVEGLIHAMSILDNVIRTIRESTSRSDAIDNLMLAYQFTKEQAEAIVQLQLYRLTNTDVQALEQEGFELHEHIKSWQALLDDESLMRQQLIIELKQTMKEFVTPRKTVIQDKIETLDIATEALIAKRMGYVTLTRDGYVKFVSQRAYLANEGKAHGHKPTDFLLATYEVENTDTLLVVTTGGQYLYLPVHIIPELKWKDMGIHLSTLIQYQSTEKIVSTCHVKDIKASQITMLLISKQGFIKRVQVADLAVQRYTKAMKIMKLQTDDEIVTCLLHQPETKEHLIVVASHDGYINTFDLEEVTVTSGRTQGIRAIKLAAADFVVGMILTHTKGNMMCYSDKNTEKMLKMSDIGVTGRYRKGQKIVKNDKKNPIHLLGISEQGQEILLQTAEETLRYKSKDLLISSFDDVGTKIKKVKGLKAVYPSY